MKVEIPWPSSLVGEKEWLRTPVGNKDHTNAAVVIIGAGISGMCTAIDLIRRNNCHNFIILEKSSGVGGTWNDNKYPGCCCDVWSMLYSYSFEQNSDWTRDYPGQEEILLYLQKVAERWGLFKHIRFNSNVEWAAWDEVEKKWKIRVTVSGAKDSEFSPEYILNSDYLVSGVGQLNQPRYPQIPGVESFQNKIMHSARWDWSYDWTGKRIGVIGNGATAAQIIPEIAKTASHVTVYQRQPNWVIPRLDGRVSNVKRMALRYIPGVQSRIRASQMDYRESFYDAVTDGDSKMADEIRQFCAMQMQAALPNQPELWEKLTPTYNPGCKRVIISDDYYPALARDNVSLETRPIQNITSDGIAVEGGEEKLDFIVLATGFRTVEFMHPIHIKGNNGRNLSEIWKGGAQAYYGTTVQDLPNFGMLYGPNTNLGHNSIILMIEAQSAYINALIKPVLEARRKGKTLALKPKPEVVVEYNEKVQEILNRSSFADPKCSSWYKNQEGRITNNWSGTVVDYQIQLSKVNWDDYEADGTAAEDVKGKRETRLGRVHEETMISNTALAMSALSAVAVAGWALANNAKLRAKILGLRAR